MALTNNYSITPLLDLTLPAENLASNSDTVGLSGGGFATVAEDSGGFSDGESYDAAGHPVAPTARSGTCHSHSMTGRSTIR